ncbi:MAG: response regulator [Verrucomicrobiota bacterium]
MSRILLVDDDDPLRNILRVTLEKMGHHVVEARNGKEALRLCQAEPPDIVLTDIVMPEAEGIELIGALRRFHSDVKIIAMSGGGRVSAADYLKIARHMGATIALAKPFSQEAIAAAIAKVSGT